MSMNDLFKGTKHIKKQVIEKFQLELNQFGLLIYNENITHLVDVVVTKLSETLREANTKFDVLLDSEKLKFEYLNKVNVKCDGYVLKSGAGSTSAIAGTSD